VRSVLRAVVASGALVIAESLAALHHLNGLRAVGSRYEVSWDCGVSTLTIAASNVPRVADHQLEVGVIVDAGTHISEVIFELFSGDFAIDLAGLPLLHEFSQDVSLRHFSRLEFRVERHIIGGGQIVDIDDAIAGIVELGVSHVHELLAELVHIAAHSAKELVEVDLSIVVFIKVFEDSLELRWTQSVAVLLETPHELSTVHFAVTVIVHASEDDAQAADTVHATRLEHIQDLAEDLIGWLTSHAERWVDVGVVSGAHHGEKGRELLVVKFAIARLVILAEERLQLEVLKGTADSLESLLELRELDSAVAFQVEVFEELASSLSFVVSSVSALTDFLEDDVFELLLAIAGDLNDLGRDVPCLQDHIDEIRLFLYWQASVDVGVVIDKGFLRDLAINSACSHNRDKVVKNGFSFLLS
jgi:hypothetical protein